jgi:hypothetical protein
VVKYHNPDGTDTQLSPNPDELQMVMDVPLSIQGTLTNTVDPAAGATNTLVVTIPSGGSNLKAGDLAFVKDSAWEIFKIVAVAGAGNTYTLTIADNSTLVNQYGNDSSASLVSPTILNKHIGAGAFAPGAEISFVRPLQVVSYTIQAVSLDPANDTATVPCLIRRTKALTAGAFGTPEVLVEGVTGFQLDWSVDGGKTWVRKANGLTASPWASVKTATNNLILASTSPLTQKLVNGMDSTADPFWFNYAPVVVKMDIETRTRIQRAEYSTTGAAGTSNFRTRRETLLVSSRNFALGQP